MDPISTSTYNLSVLDRSPSQKSMYVKRTFWNLLPQILAAVIATSNHLTVGCLLAYSAILIPQLEDKNSEIKVTKDMTSWIASVLVLVGPPASILTGIIMDRYGRLMTLKLSITSGILGWLFIAFANSIPILIAGRMIGGLAAILVSSPGIVYATEIAEKDIRGSLVSLGPFFVSFGMALMYLQGYLLNWRIIAWICQIYVIVPCILFFFIPESPVWLISKGRKAEAQKALNFLYKNYSQPADQSGTYSDMIFHQLVQDDEQKKSEATEGSESMWPEFLKPTGYKPLLIISGVFFFQQFAGVYIILFHCVKFFQAVGTNINPYIASVWIGVIRLVMSIFSTFLMRRMTRRFLITISAFGMCISMIISGLFTFWIKNGSTTLTWVPVSFVFFYVVCSMCGLLTIPWTMTAELFPLKIRSMAHSVATCIANVMMFLAVQNYLNMEKLFGGSAGVQWFFASISFLAVVFFTVFLPETHGKQLSEIQEYFENNTIYLGKRTKKPTDDTNKKKSKENQNLIKSI